MLFFSLQEQKDQVEYGAKHSASDDDDALLAKKIMCLLHCCLFPKDQRLLNNNVIYTSWWIWGRRRRKICNNTLHLNVAAICVSKAKLGQHIFWLRGNKIYNTVWAVHRQKESFIMAIIPLSLDTTVQQWEDFVVQPFFPVGRAHSALIQA